jgi:hypothetical protein
VNLGLRGAGDEVVSAGARNVRLDVVGVNVSLHNFVKDSDPIANSPGDQTIV